MDSERAGFGVSRNPNNYTRQTWALIHRYLITLLSRPVSSLLRNLVWPGLMMGIAIHLMINLNNDSELLEQYKAYIISLAPNVVKSTIVFIVYYHGDWMVKDRATGFKSLMITMGLERSTYILSNILIPLFALLPIIITLSIFSMIYLIPDTHCPAILVLLLFILFTLQLIGFLHFVVSFITSQSWTVLILPLVFLESYPMLLFNQGMKDGGDWRYVLILLDTLTPFGSIDIFLQSYNVNKNNGTIDYIRKNGESYVSSPTYLLFIGSIFWTLFYFIFARWWEEVCPWRNDSAVRRPSFRLKCDADFEKFESITLDSQPKVSQKYFERQDENREVGIRVNCVSKLFGSSPALTNVSLNILKGETTLLLGHNGAGKSTLMNIILGLLHPNKGKVYIKSSDDFVQCALGVCPQTSILDDSLTVRQHLELFADLKSSMSAIERRNHINQTLRDINLESHADKRPSELSGGMKRKLSLGMAFIGNSDVLILDEPSSGLDPDSRVFIWNAIRRYRADRTVLLSTQHMEEADYLGDRIAIMSGGQVVCSGSSVFLNKLFGTGYKMRVECLSSKRLDILALIRKHFERAKLDDPSIELDESARGASMDNKVVDFVLELNTSKDAEHELIRLMELFENEGDKLGIRSYGLKSSSIEDVMLNTGKLFANEGKESSTRLTMATLESHIATLIAYNARRASGWFWGKLWALLIKIILSHYHDWFSFVCFRLAIPSWVLYVLIGSIGESSSSAQSFYPIGIFMYLVYLPVLERSTGFKNMQLTSSTGVTTYWLAFFIVDVVVCLILLIPLNILLEYAIPSRIVVLRDLHLVTSLAFVAFYSAAMMMSYVFSLIFEDARTAVGYFSLVNMTTLMLYLFVLLVREAITRKANALLVPINYLGIALLPGNAFSYMLSCLRGEQFVGSNVSTTPFGGETSKGSLVVAFGALTGQVGVYLLLLILAECQYIDLAYHLNFRNCYRLCFGKSVSLDDGTKQPDQDVLDESRRALVEIERVSRSRPDQQSYSLIAAELSKSYIRGIDVIRKLSFTVKSGECFGLLGVNGAGKTTVFSMLSAESKPDEGTIWANNCFVDHNRAEYRTRLGYDPQTSPDLLLTVDQALHLMGRLRALPEHSINKVIDSILELLDMSEHRHKLAAKLSGGTKRKLSLGMSLIGAPQLLALDEPTAGVDPLARRGVWQILKSLRKQNNGSIVISSHAMEECEAICDRISIMARGRLHCIGTFLHLRSKFAQGCTLRIQISPPTVATPRKARSSSPPSVANGQKQPDDMRQIDEILAELQRQLVAAVGANVVELADKNVSSATFRITDNRVRRSILLGIMREFKQLHPNLNLHYMLNDASLEDIFISIARQQN